LQDNWFTRGWVVREAGFAQDARVYWGHFEVPFLDRFNVK
jgi:hypothetical protein